MIHLNKQNKCSVCESYFPEGPSSDSWIKHYEQGTATYKKWEKVGNPTIKFVYTLKGRDFASMQVTFNELHYSCDNGKYRVNAVVFSDNKFILLDEEHTHHTWEEGDKFYSDSGYLKLDLLAKMRERSNAKDGEVIIVRQKLEEDEESVNAFKKLFNGIASEEVYPVVQTKFSKDKIGYL